MLISNGTSVGAGKIDIFPFVVNFSEITLTTDEVPRGLTIEAFACEDPIDE